MRRLLPAPRLRGLRVIITGASSGIGEALAIECARRGMHVGLAARRLDHLERLAERLRECPRCRGAQIEVAALDVQQPEQVLPILSGLAHLLGGVDVVIANAGILKARPAGDGRFQQDADLFATNVLGAIATSEAAIQLFRLQGTGGRLVAISSYSAFLPLPSCAAYSASKAAVTNYFNAIRAPLLQDNIAVTVVHPSFVKTDMINGISPRGLPFVARADDVAVEIMDAVAAKKRNPIVPKRPWSWLHQIQRFTPDQWILEIQKRLP
ncbi:MAG: hypothetical protein RLY58_2070 [Pseudomonadota bacterium]|jgi:short-subunit dehydrogenase